MMLFLACLDLTFAFVLTLNMFPPAVKPNISKPHKIRLHTMEQCNEQFGTCFALLSKDGGFLGQVLYGRGDLPGNVRTRFPETINLYCKSLGAGLSCVDDALRGCSSLIEKPVIKKVRAFMRSFRQIDLCTKDTYREAFIDQDECFFGLRSDPVRSQCVHALVSKMNAAQQNVLAVDGNVDSLFGEYCRAYQIFTDCISDDLRHDCGLRGRDIILHNFYQVMGFQGRKRVCNAPVRSNEVPIMNNDVYLNSAFSHNYIL
ncbi:uncharacterized protein LOC129590244 [Paramacrobiotus metropolitanus]|uniref:uncharacterized protein LOC129590244 n=1 Tax=Paramacrobiotus metropolitanus TaxID=2943436 RepID=UPI002445967C|nr:uncharacterized protein LOC129590244 [Paramacrobiotus metropolitanus]